MAQHVDQAAQVKRWLEGKGYKLALCQLELDLEKEQLVKQSVTEIHKEVEQAVQFSSSNEVVAEELSVLLCAVFKHVAVALAQRDGYEASSAVVDAIGIVSHDSCDLVTLRRQLQHNPSAPDLRQCSKLVVGSTAVNVLRRFFESRRLTYLAAVLCDPEKIHIIKGVREGTGWRVPKMDFALKRKNAEEDQRSASPDLLMQRFDFYAPCDFSCGGWAEASQSTPFICMAKDKNIVKYLDTEAEGSLTACQGSCITEVTIVKDSYTLVGSVDGYVRLWSEMLQPIASYVHVDTSVLSMKSCKASPSLFAVGTTEAQVAVWSTEYVAAPVQLYNLPAGTFTSCLDFHPTANNVLFSADTGIRIWDLRAGTQQAAASMPTEVTCIAAVSENQVVAGLDNSALAVIDLRTGKARQVPMAAPPISLSRHPNNNAVAIACAGDSISEVITWLPEGTDTTHTLSAAPFVVKWADGDAVICGTAG